LSLIETLDRVIEAQLKAIDDSVEELFE